MTESNSDLEEKLESISPNDLKRARTILGDIAWNFWKYSSEEQDKIIDVLLEKYKEQPLCQSDNPSLYMLGDSAQRILCSIYFRLEQAQKDKIKSTFIGKVREERCASYMIRDWLRRVDTEKEFEYLYNQDELYNQIFPEEEC